MRWVLVMEKALKLVKAKLGITVDSRDEYLMAIIEGVKDEIEKGQGIELNLKDSSMLMFLVDYSAWRYNFKTGDGGMPKHIYWRLRNLMVEK